MSMRKSRKLISLAIAVVFLLSAMVPAAAFAAGHTAEEEAGARLRALGIIEGYPDGSLGLDRAITRAEMTVVLSEMAGMSNAASILQNVPSTFTDVATGVWYTGYVNLAANQGWVAGYPDGTFKPNAQVTYAEAITMLLNVLGYSKGELPGTWPSNYLIKAADLNITSGVSFVSSAAAVRGSVFIMASATLDKPTVTWSRDTATFITGPTLLSGLGFAVVEDWIITDAWMLLGSDMDADDREVTVTDGTVTLEVTVAPGVDVRSLVGVKADYYYDADDKVILALESTDGADWEELDTITVAGSVYDLVLDNDDVYDIENAIVIINEQLADVADLDDVSGGMVRIATDGNDATLVDIILYGEMEHGLVDEVSIEDGIVEVTFKTGTGSAADVASIDTEDEVVKALFGVDEVTDIGEWDVFYWNEASGDFAIYVVGEIVAGEATTYNTNRIRVAGTNYTLGADWYYSLDGGDSFDAGPVKGTTAALSTLADFSEEDVIVVLDAFGEIFAIMAGEARAPSTALQLSGIQSAPTFDGVNYRIKVFLATGVEAFVMFESGDVEVDLRAVNLGTPTVETVVNDPATYDFARGFIGKLWDYTLNDDGEIDSLTLLAENAVFDELTENDLVRSRIVDTNDNRWFVTSSTIFFDASDLANPAILSWDDVRVLGDVQTAGDLYLGVSPNLAYVVFTDDVVDVEADEAYAVYLDAFKLGNDVYVQVITASGVASYVYDGVTDLAVVTDAFEENDSVELEFVGDKLASVTVRENISEQSLGLSPYNSTRNTITVVEGEFDVTEDTLIVNNTGSTPVVVAASSVRRNDVVVGWYEGFELRVLVIID